MFFKPTLPFLLASALFTGPANAAVDACKEVTADSATAESGRQRISSIEVLAGDLFDHSKPNQRRIVHRVANTLHITTLARSVLAALPIRAGDTYSPARLAESERILRAKRHIRDASVKAVRSCDSGIVVQVHTIDNWTLTPSLSFGRAGGDSSYTIELQELNFLGSGKEFKLHSRKSGKLRESSFLYGDDNVFGGRHRVRMEYGDNDDGELYAIGTGLPFFSDSATNSWWLYVSSETLSFTLSDADAPGTPVLTELAEIRYDRRLRYSSNDSVILGGGFRYARQSTNLAGSESTISSTFDYHDLYPFVEAQWIRNAWLKSRNYENIRVNEDINLGYSFRTELGVLHNSVGDSSRNVLRLNASMKKGLQFNKHAFHKFELAQTRYINDQNQKHAWHVRYQYFRGLNRNNQLNLRFTAEKVRGYSPIHDVFVGGENGLKAYPNRFQQGENRVIGLAEYRYITNWSPYALVNTALSVFFESGRAWSDNESEELLANTGVGLLLSPTRSSRAAINRFEIAVPLVQAEGVGKFQIFIGTKVNY